MYERQKGAAAEITGLRNSGRVDEAIEMCRQAALQFPEDSFFAKLLGDMYRQNGRFQEAAEEYLKMLKLIQPDQFHIFVKSYRKLERSASFELMRVFREELRDIFDKKEVPEELRKDLSTFLGKDFVSDASVRHVAAQAEDDRNFWIVRKEIDRWESVQDIGKIEALAECKLNGEQTVQSRKTDTFLIHRLEKLGKNDLALSLIEKTKKPYTEKLIVAAILRICRKKSDYSFAERVLRIDERFIEASDFNIQYELVYYFQTVDYSDGLEKTLRLMRDNSAAVFP